MSPSVFGQDYYAFFFVIIICSDDFGHGVAFIELVLLFDSGVGVFIWLLCIYDSSIFAKSFYFDCSYVG